MKVKRSKDAYRARKVGESTTSCSGALNRTVWIDKIRKRRGARTVFIGPNQCEDDDRCQAWI